MSEMESNPEVPASTRDKALLIPAAMREESRGVPCNAKGDLTCLKRHQRVPQVDTTLERNSNFPAATPRKPCMLDEALFIPAVMREESCSVPHKAKGDLTSMRRHEQVPQIDTQLERKHKLPATTPRKP